MAASTGGTETNTVMSLFAKHLQKRSEKSLRSVPVLYELFDKRPLPGKSGATLFVPRHIAVSGIRVLVEGTVLDTCSTSAHYYSATVKGYGDVRRYSDFLVMVHEIPTMISDDIEYMSRDAGLYIDNLCRTAISAKATSSTQIVTPNGAAVANDVLSATNLKQSALFQANTRLAAGNAPTYADGTYAGVFHPKQTHDLFISTSGGNQLNRILLGSAAVGGFLQQTEFGAQKLERATMGILGNIRVIQNTNAPKAHNGGAAAMGFSAGSSGWGALIMGPGAAAAIDLETARLKTFIKPIGSAGALDCLDQLMTAGVKFYFAACAMDVSNRLLSIPSGKTL